VNASTVPDAGWAIVCDFDGTAIMGDIADALALRYLGEEQFRHVNAQFERGAITFRELLHALFGPIAASAIELRAFVREYTRFRPGFQRLLALANAHDMPFLIASGGLDIYITPALELLPAALTANVTVRANHAQHVPGGLSLSFPHENDAGSCGTCGSCKGAAVRALQKAGYRVIAIGDGHADRCMAQVAETLFARARLRDWCDQSRLRYTAFETLDTVADWLEAQLYLRGTPIDDAYTSIA
jgi:2-hydroxy-3-keto-5-methylthiopentenyl-1-phosphate phosphatase